MRLNFKDIGKLHPKYNMQILLTGKFYVIRGRTNGKYPKPILKKKIKKENT